MLLRILYLRAVFACMSACVFVTALTADLVEADKAFKPFVAESSEEGLRAIAGFAVPTGFKVDLVAAEPMLANPVAFDIDHQGRIYVAETFRHGAGVLDIRGRLGWPSALYKQSLPPERINGLSDELLDMDLSLRSVDQRIGMLEHYFYDQAGSLRIASERIRRLLDLDGDGLMDVASVFADGFSALEDGIGAGVLAYGNRVWFTNIPHLWEMKDSDGDGIADFKRSVHQGFGVRTGFLGHDLHGLTMGPDGRLYFSIGDRGARVVASEGLVDVPDTGAVFRCELDGSKLEVFAFGLRNPQELAFDDYGNWFTGDNNSDGGDKARWVHLVEGGDSGWRIGYQFFEGGYRRGPWNAEKLWHPAWAEQAAYIVPPVDNLGNGPSGLSYYPGTGLPDSYKEHFFLADFRGGAGSGVHAFNLKPNGATFEIDKRENFIWEVLVTDVGFGIEGGLYLTDWVSGWNKNGKGRVYRVHHPDGTDSALSGQTKKILREGLRNVANPASFLSHADRRVRLEAQFELANRGEEGVKALSSVAAGSDQTKARLHAVWGLGQVARRGDVTSSSPAGSSAGTLVALLDDRDPEVRAQVCRMIGEARISEGLGGLIQSCFDASLRVRFEAMMALGKLGFREAVPSILEPIRADKTRDPYLRHAAVMALVGIHDLETIVRLAGDQSPDIRMVSLLAMRRLQMREISQFLKDPEPLLVREAARAVNDTPIVSARADLAFLLYSETEDPVIVRRSINSNLREGRKENSMALASAIVGGQLSEDMILEAMDALGEWPSPSGRDRVTGIWNPVVQSTRDSSIPRDAFELVWDTIVQSGRPAVITRAVEVALKLKSDRLQERLSALLGDLDMGFDVRSTALEGLDELKSPFMENVLTSILSDESDPLKVRASKIALRVKPELVMGELDRLIDEGRMSDRQEAISSLANLQGQMAKPFVVRLLNQMVEEGLPRELHLEVLQVADLLDDEDVDELISEYRSMEFGGDAKLAEYREVLYGGNRFKGRTLFMERVDLSCLRCHVINGEGGQVGPDLTDLGNRYDRETILQSIVDPGAVIAQGYENVVVQLNTGLSYGGILQNETEDRIVLNSVEDGLLDIPKDRIQFRSVTGSGMPGGLHELMSKSELRDLIEFLSASRGRFR